MLTITKDSDACWRLLRGLVGMLVVACATSGCDQPQRSHAEVDVEAPHLVELHTKCYAGQVKACDTYREQTGKDLSFAENVRKAQSKPKTKGAEF